MSELQPEPVVKPETKKFNIILLIEIILIILALMAGAFLRSEGVNWDENRHLHPDERFLSLVMVAINPVEKAADYFNSELSPLNPHNRGYTFFVYGTLPIFIIRYVSEALKITDYDGMTIIGRQLSTIADLVTIMLLYFIGKRLYKGWVGALAAFLYAFAALPIQLSHYMTVDTFTNTFGLLTIYAGVLILTRKISSEPLSTFWQWLVDLLPYAFFGIALGMATGSKINAVVLAALLPLIEVIRFIRTPVEARNALYLRVLVRVVVAAFFTLLVFRIVQPYAFNGPGFFDVGINQSWLNNMKSLSAQASGDVDFPPALQWARRPITFSFTNMVIWGLGLPLGAAGFISFFCMGVQIFKKKDWHIHLPLWLWSGLYFLWQAVSFVRSMRYQMLVYPSFALFAAWGLVSLWQKRAEVKLFFLKIKPQVIKTVGVVLTLLVLLGTAAWGYAFSRIYSRQHPRVEASRWIFQNIPGAANLIVNTAEGDIMQPLPYRFGDGFTALQSFSMPFVAYDDYRVATVLIPNIVDQMGDFEEKTMRASIFDADGVEVAFSTLTQSYQAPADNWRGSPSQFLFTSSDWLVKGQLYYLVVSAEHGDGLFLVNGVPKITGMDKHDALFTQDLAMAVQSVRADTPYVMDNMLNVSGKLTQISIPQLVDLSASPKPVSLRLTIRLNAAEAETAQAEISGVFAPDATGAGKPVNFVLNKALQIEENQSITFTLEMIDGDGRIALYGATPVHESSWDDALPVPVDGFNPYSDYGGIYRGDLNFEMYWPDEASKRDRFISNLDQADYIFISSNRQWGTTVRVPERYPLTTYYYQQLIGCPEGEDILVCYADAVPGMYQGNLGYELIKVVHSMPNLGALTFNSQYAEEAFTVYDHPKVLIFKKTADYDPLKTRELLNSVDLSKVIYMTPKQASSSRNQADGPTLMLTDEQFEHQKESGTWSEMFDRNAWVNQSQIVAVLVMYMAVMAIGIGAYPIMRLAFPGLKDRGYPFFRLGGLLLLTFCIWILGSVGVDFTRTTISLTAAVLLLISVILGVIQRKAILNDLKENWRYILFVELLALLAFVAFLLIRYANPDLWHPYKGGERPMDFAYLNAVMKSNGFPAYDPWFAGGYMNYYYYGFVIVGVLIKWLGVVPTVAYNIVLPILFSMLVLGAFSIGWNIYCGVLRNSPDDTLQQKRRKRFFTYALLVGGLAALLLVVLGNQATVKLIVDGWAQLGGGTPGVKVTIAQRISQALQGFGVFIKGTPMPFYPGTWYWNPSRVIPGEAITEFPFFTFLYGDLHAHLIALPITVFVVGWLLSLVLSKARWGEVDGKHKWLGCAAGVLIGAIALGALRPTNTWDFYTYCVFAFSIVVYMLWKVYKPVVKNIPDWLQRAVFSIGLALAFLALAYFLYFPFSKFYGQAYNSISLWKGDRTPLDSYLVHWGLFLFIMFGWLVWETYHWMASTPASALKKLKQSQSLIIVVAVILGLALVAFLVAKIVVALVIIPMLVWAFVLMQRADQHDGKRFVLFMMICGLGLSLAVELICLPVGDIGRMNVVFKFYLQAWVLMALASGACLGWLLKSYRYWNRSLQFIWQLILFVMLVSAALFPVLATADKIRDRFTADLPKTLDGAEFMKYSAFGDGAYADSWRMQALVQDYDVIRWMQDNISGSPVILEGQAYEYRWGTRYTMFTGLPGVIGYNFHQRQQRAYWANNSIQERVDAVGLFYLTEDENFVRDFIEKYDIRYIVVGQLEQAFYPGAGLDKFAQFDGKLWKEVYRSGDTILYEVIR